MKKTKKFVFTVLIIVYLLGVMPRQGLVVVAEGEEQQQEQSSPSPEPSSSPDPSPEPSADPSPSPDPSPDPSPSPETEAAIFDEPSPSPSPSSCDPECPPADVEQNNDADITNEVDADANTGNNEITASPSPEPLEEQVQEQSQEENTENHDGGSAAIDTGNASTEVEVINEANSNLINSDYVVKIDSIYIDSEGNIDLTKSTSTTLDAATVNAIQNNTASVENVINANSNTGNNSITDVGGAITTGSAYVVVNIINFINVNMINSSWQFVIINIFGQHDGDIILPDFDALGIQLPSENLGDITQTNYALIENDIDQEANTGNNSEDPSVAVATGDAQNASNVQTFANFNLINSSFYQLIVNNFGNWNGMFLGWEEEGAAAPTYGQMVFGGDFNALLFGGSGYVAGEQSNSLSLLNSINASSNTGNNLLSSGGAIRTGNAFTAVNLINFVNANIINSVGFFGIINIFGTLNGDIGGADFFQTQQAAAPQAQQTAVSVKGEGGLLTTSMETNVGTHINPGDTVMFFIKVKNPGTGPVYDSKVTFNLFDSNGQLAALQNFDIGHMDPGQTAYISFGMVLSNTAPNGHYEALMQADGKVGPNDDTISSMSYTSFLVGLGGLAGSIIPEVQAAANEQIPELNELQSGIQYPEPWGNLFLILFFLGAGRALQMLYRKRNEEPIEVEDHPAN